MDNDLESGPLPGLNPALTNMGEEIDTPTLFTALFPSLDPGQEPAVRVQRLPVHGEVFILRSRGQQRAPQSCLPRARQDMLQL